MSVAFPENKKIQFASNHVELWSSLLQQQIAN